MAPTPEPRFARVAAMIADPTRARMLALLLSGEFRAAGEVARAVSVTPATASSHLAKLVDAGLVSVRQQGRHRYFRLADDEIAHALESLSLVAERDQHLAKWDRGSHRPLKHARTCYGHLAGELGVRLFEMLVRREFLAAEAGDGGGGGPMRLTDRGRAWVESIGMDPATVGSARRYAYPCLDWSERRDHLAGNLATGLLRHIVQQDWLRPVPDSRVLAVTEAGRRRLLPLLEAAR